MVVNVIKMLTDRGKRLDLHHYEALIHAHTLHQDVRKALNVLCIMGRAGLTPDSSSTRSIYQVLRDSSAATDLALSMLQELRQQYDVPIAAFNVVLEATAAHHGFKKAQDLYRGVRRVSVGGPDRATYHVLLSSCTKRRSMNYVLDEMEGFSIHPDRTTYDHLVRICAMQTDVEPAFAYLEKMEANRWWLSRASALALIRQLIQAEDSRVRGIIETCRKRRMAIEPDIRRLFQKIYQSKLKKEANKANKVKADVTAPALASAADPGSDEPLPLVVALPEPPAKERPAESMSG